MILQNTTQRELKFALNAGEIDMPGKRGMPTYRLVLGPLNEKTPGQPVKDRLPSRASVEEVAKANGLDPKEVLKYVAKSIEAAKANGEIEVH